MHLRTIAALAFFALVSCPHTNSTVYAVHLTDACRDPQITYTRDSLSGMDDFGGGHFVMDGAATASATVTVDCAPTSSGAPGELNLDTDRVTIDPALVAGELAWIAVLYHEVGGHWQIHRGPHPERARVHPCPTADYLGDPALCNTDHWTETMVMAPTSPGIGTASGGWTGDVEDVGSLPHSQITMADAEFVQWGLAP